MALSEEEDRRPLSAVVGENVYLERANKGARGPKMSQEALAARSGLFLETIRVIEAGRDETKRQLDIRLSTIEKLAEGLGVEPEVLVRRTRAFLQPKVPKLDVIPGEGRDRFRRALGQGRLDVQPA